MATFIASTEHRFSEDGTEQTTWAHFTQVPHSDPAVYEFTTRDPVQMTALRNLIDARLEGYRDIVEIRRKTRVAR